MLGDTQCVLAVLRWVRRLLTGQDASAVPEDEEEFLVLGGKGEFLAPD